MPEHFLEYIKIIDFKCLKEFRVDSLQHVNLISGKNNIGKTVFLEACYVNAYGVNVEKLALSLSSTRVMRENINLLSKCINDSLNIMNIMKNYLEFLKVYSTSSNHNQVEFFVSYSGGKNEYSFTINNQKTIVNANEFSFATSLISNVEYIDNFGWSDRELIEAYQIIQKNDDEEELNKLIQNFDSSIDAFKVIGDIPQCKCNGEYYNLVEFGDGLKHYISVICALYAAENGYLFIDEIDNGIHYTQLENIWKIIFDVSKKVNCQVFATTHSKECIEAFTHANIQDEGAYFEFYKNNKTDKIVASKRDKEQLEYALKHQGRIRGE